MTKTGQFSNQASLSRDRFTRFLCADDGLSIVEYAIAAGLIAAAIAVSMGTLGVTVDALIVTLNAAL
jgi:Flp pilus assembly pilin Flp